MAASPPEGPSGVEGPSADLGPLVDAARQGDIRALDQLVRATYADAYTLALRLTGNPEDAADVVQDAYLRAYRALSGFRGDAQFTTWLYRITANCAATTLVKRRRSRTEPLAEDAAVVDVRADRDPQLRAASGDERAAVSAALAGLPSRLRQVIVLRDIYDLPHRAIAAELGISEAAAKVRLHRARRRLKDTLASHAPVRSGGRATDELAADELVVDSTAPEELGPWPGDCRASQSEDGILGVADRAG